MKWLLALLHKIFAGLVSLFLVASPVASIPHKITLGVANTQIRQEVNITDAYMMSPSGSYATSSEIVALTDTTYSAPRYYFEVVASTTAGTTASVDLVYATSSKKAATISITGGNVYQRYRSSAFLPIGSSTIEYKVVLNNEAIGKGIIAARVVVLQNAATLTNTETQIEIGSNVLATTSTPTTPLSTPKYWYYDSSKWDTATVYAEVTFQNTQTSSSTLYTTATTTKSTLTYVVSSTTSYTVVEAWGAGGGGANTAGTTGGGGAGGGAYARSTTTLAVGTSHTLILPPGGAAGSTTPAQDTTFDTTTVVADSATGVSGATGGAAGTAANSTGTTKSDGGAGNNGLTTNDTGGGGGGAAGPNGAGTAGQIAQTSVGGGGGNANGVAGTQANGGATGAPAKSGNWLATGGNGGGGSFTSLEGAPGGYPGGGGGGGDNTGTAATGAAGQMKLTEINGAVGIALQESDGTGDGFSGWAFKVMIATTTRGLSTTSPLRLRSDAFTPTSGRNYRLVASSTRSDASYSIYNGKIIVDQASAGASETITFGVANNADNAIYGDAQTPGRWGQKFTPSANATAATVHISSNRFGSPVDNLCVRIYADSGGSPDNATPLGTASCIVGSSLPTSGFQANALTMGTLALVSGTQYWIVEYRDGATDTGNAYRISYDTTVTTLPLKYTDSLAWNNTLNAEVYGSIDLSSAAGNLSKLQPQYLLAPFKLLPGTALQTFLTSWDSTEWSTTNVYIHQMEANDGSASVAEIDTAAGIALVNSSVSSPDNRATSTPMCMPATGNLDVKGTTNNNDIFANRILVDVGTSQTASCPAANTNVITTPVTNVQGLINTNGLITQ